MKINEKGVLSSSNFYFHTPSDTAKSLFFYLLYAGKFYCDGTYSVKRDNFNSYLLMYIRKGQGSVVYDDKTYTAKANDIILLNCHEPHAYFTTTGWESVWIHFDGNVSGQYFKLLYSQLGSVIPLKESLLIPKYMELIIEGFAKSKPLPEPVVSCYIQWMLAELMLISSRNVFQKPDKINPVLDALTYVESRFKEKISMKKLAGYVNMSQFHFSRVFKKETGYTPYEYIIKTRINYAKNLLKKTGLNIKQIAFESGFGSESNFIYRFHANVGMTPDEFRKTTF